MAGENATYFDNDGIAIPEGEFYVVSTAGVRSQAAILPGMSTRIVTTTATALSLTQTEHAERIVLVNTNSTVANTYTLPAASGSGAKYTVINNVVQTQGTVVVAANGTDVMQGTCVALDSTAGGGQDTFMTTATSDKVSLNLTTTGGLGGDMVEAWDISANTWYVRVLTCGSGTLATPFSAT